MLPGEHLHLGQQGAQVARVLAVTASSGGLRRLRLLEPGGGEDLAQHVEDAQESILTVEAAIAADTVLTQAEKQALLGVYRSYVAAHAAAETSQAPKRASRRGDDHIS